MGLRMQGSPKQGFLSSQCGGPQPPPPNARSVQTSAPPPQPPPQLKEGRSVPPIPPIPGGQRPGVAERMGQPWGVAATRGGPSWGLRTRGLRWRRGGGNILRPLHVP